MSVKDERYYSIKLASIVKAFCRPRASSSEGGIMVDVIVPPEKELSMVETLDGVLKEYLRANTVEAVETAKLEPERTEASDRSSSGIS